MATRGRDLQRPLGALLALHVAQIGQVGPGRPHGGLGPRHQLRALEVVGELDEGARRQHVEVAAGPGGLRPAGRGADQPVAGRIGGDRGRQHARHRRDGTVEREFAQHREAAERVRRDGADGRHDAERDRQVVVAALLGQVGRREVDGDALRRQGQPRGGQRRADPLAGFGDRLVAEADDVEHHGAVGDLNLDVDRASLDPLEGDRRNPHDHRALTDAIQDGWRLARVRPRRKALTPVPVVQRRVLIHVTSRQKPRPKATPARKARAATKMRRTVQRAAGKTERLLAAGAPAVSPYQRMATSPPEAGHGCPGTDADHPPAPRHAALHGSLAVRPRRRLRRRPACRRRRA